MKIIVAEKTSPSAIKMLRAQPHWNVITADQLKDDLAAQLVDADALIVRSAVDVNAKLLENGKKLRVIGRAGVGVDNIDLNAATKQGIVVMNTPGANAVAVAEHTLALMLSLARNLSRADSTTRAGKWEKKSLQGSELRGKTLGIVGLGRVGVEVAKRAAAFGMKLIAHDPYVAQNAVKELNITLASLDELYAAADYITLHVGLTPQTEGMVSESAIKKMKKGVRIINCARGELIQDDALAAALKAGQVGGAALDVFVEEPPKNSPLLACENVVATPHIAGSTNEAQEAVGIQIAQQVMEYLKRGVIQNAVNVPSVSDEEYADMHPYMEMAENLGSFLAQIADTDASLESISLDYAGQIAGWKTDLIRNSAIKGILNVRVPDKANLVNAAAVAGERGIAVHESKNPGDIGRSGSTLGIQMNTADGKIEAKGSVLRGNRHRLLSVGDIHIEAPLHGDLIFLRNRDVPGVIGAVGTITGKHNVNIASFSLGRSEAKGAEVEAIAIVQVDSEVPTAAIDELKKVHAVKQVRKVVL